MRILAYARKLASWLSKQCRCVYQCSKISNRIRGVQYYSRRLLLDIELMFNLIQLTVGHSLWRKRYSGKAEMMLSLCRMELRHGKLCWLLRLVDWRISRLMLKNMLPLFVDLCQNIVPSCPLIFSEGLQQFLHRLLMSARKFVQSRQQENKS